MLGLQEDKQNHNHQLGALGTTVAKHEEFPAPSEATLILNRETHTEPVWTGPQSGMEESSRAGFYTCLKISCQCVSEFDSC